MSVTLGGLVREAAARLAVQLSPAQDAALDAEVLARHALGWDRARWLSDARTAPPPGFAERFDGLISRRATGEPVAYITGTREFWGLDFDVTPAVLVPRPETEILVEQALSLIDGLNTGRGGEGASTLRVADVGTGSGCIAVALAHARPRLQVVATDVSAAALDVARRNAARHGVTGRVIFVKTSLLDGVGDVDLVTSNPPYIGTRDIENVMPEVRAYEPAGALFAGEEGLDVIRALLREIAGRRPPPPLLCEFGGDLAPIRGAVDASGLRLAAVAHDLAGRPRVARVEA